MKTINYKIRERNQKVVDKIIRACGHKVIRWRDIDRYVTTAVKCGAIDVWYDIRVLCEAVAAAGYKDYGQLMRDKGIWPLDGGQPIPESKINRGL